jgi:multisubunit Na+/H+ antiporter MnhE subunit
MTHGILLTVFLTVLYLVVLASVQPGDVLVGGVLSAAIAAVAERVRRRPGHRVPPLALRAVAAPLLAGSTVAAIVRGTWHVALYALGRRRIEQPGIVAIPAGHRTPSGVAVWGYLTALSPDEIVVDIDEERGVLLVHVLDASDPEAIRARHHDAYERRQRRVFP